MDASGEEEKGRPQGNLDKDGRERTDQNRIEELGGCSKGSSRQTKWSDICCALCSTGIKEDK